MTVKEDDKGKVIKEKEVDNKITINPKLSEAVEEIGGEVLEMVEVGEMVDPKPDWRKVQIFPLKKEDFNRSKSRLQCKKLQAIRHGDQKVMSSHEPEGDMIDERTRYC